MEQVSAHFRPNIKGFSTVEMLIAMSVMSLMLGAILMLLFSSQTFVSDAIAHADALGVASSLIATERTFAQADFNLLAASSSMYAVGSTSYNASIAVDLENDYVTRKLTADVSWKGSYARTEHVTLTAYVSDYQNASNSNTCNINGDWSRPAVQNAQTNFAQIIGDGSGTYQLGGIDVYKGKLYVTALVSGATKKNFFIFNTTKGPNLQLLGSLDTTGPSLSQGANAITVATSSLGSYAYLANAYNTAQLQIVDIANPASTTMVANYQLPTTTTSAHITGAGTGGASGNSIFYKDGYVYLGLTKTTTGPEFNIIDVHNPHAPVWIGGYKVGFIVNAIYVANNVAYLAHPTDSSAGIQEQVTALSLADKTNPVRIGGYKAPDNKGNGKSLYVAGDNIYLGRTLNTTAGSDDVYELQNLQPSAGIKINSSVNALLARGTSVFFLDGIPSAPGSLQIFNPVFSTSTPLGTLSMPGSSIGEAMDCEDNAIYAASNNASTSQSYLSVIYP